MPKLDTPVIDDNGYLTPPWYRFMISLWQKVGSGFTQLPISQVVTASSPAHTDTIVLNALTGDVVGGIPIPGTPAADQIVMEAITLQPLPDPPDIAPIDIDTVEEQAALLALMLSSSWSFN